MKIIEWLKWLKRKPSKECYNTLNNIIEWCQSKKVSNNGNGKIAWIDKLFCRPCNGAKKERDDNKMAREEEAIKHIENIMPYVGENIKKSLSMAIEALEQKPKLGKDGTLIVNTEHYKNVSRVLVQHGTNGTLFYQD